MQIYCKFALLTTGFNEKSYDNKRNLINPHSYLQSSTKKNLLEIELIS